MLAHELVITSAMMHCSASNTVSMFTLHFVMYCTLCMQDCLTGTLNSIAESAGSRNGIVPLDLQRKLAAVAAVTDVTGAVDDDAAVWSRLAREPVHLGYNSGQAAAVVSGFSKVIVFAMWHWYSSLIQTR
jgi:hypothetical protein